MSENTTEMLKREIAEAIEHYLQEEALLSKFLPYEYASDVVNEWLDNGEFYDEGIM